MLRQVAPRFLNDAEAGQSARWSSTRMKRCVWELATEKRMFASKKILISLFFTPQRRLDLRLVLKQAFQSFKPPDSGVYTSQFSDRLIGGGTHFRVGFILAQRPSFFPNIQSARETSGLEIERPQVGQQSHPPGRRRVGGQKSRERGR